MTFNPDIHHRHSIRLRDYDYSQAGAYFVTICAKEKECLFGEVRAGDVILNEYGRIVMDCWQTIPGHFANVECDEFVIMPNHVHGIIILNNVGAQFIAPAGNAKSVSQPSAINRNVNQGVINQDKKEGVINHAPTIGEIMRAFKARCTHMINQIRNTPGAPVWQRNYYEHVIRNEPELNKIREYIINNPVNWLEDENYKI